MFRCAGKLRLSKGDVLNLPVVVARVQNKYGRSDVLEAALSEKTLRCESRRQRRYAGGIQLRRGAYESK